MNTATRAPKGGVTVMGVFYKGGQFLPTNEPQRGKWNRKSNTAKKARKMEYAPYKWDYAPAENMVPLFRVLNGSFKYNHNTGTFEMPSPQVQAYMKWTNEFCQDYINRYNNGQRWELV